MFVTNVSNFTVLENATPSTWLYSSDGQTLESADTLWGKFKATIKNFFKPSAFYSLRDQAIFNTFHEKIRPFLKTVKEYEDRDRKTAFCGYRQSTQWNINPAEVFTKDETVTEALKILKKEPLLVNQEEVAAIFREKKWNALSEKNRRVADAEFKVIGSKDTSYSFCAAYVAIYMVQDYLSQINYNTEMERQVADPEEINYPRVKELITLIVNQEFSTQRKSAQHTS